MIYSISRSAKKSFATLFIALLMALPGCGGGGGGGATPTDPNQLFSLSTLNSTALGTIYSSQLTGVDSNGTNLTGSISLANRAQTMLGGVLVTPRDVIYTITGGGTTVTVTGTGFIDTSGNLVSLESQTTGVTCTPVSPDNLPVSVKIGDFGILSTLICDDNTTQERSWRVEDGSNGTIRIISNATSKDQFSNIIAIADVTYRIDINSNIVSVKLVTTDVAGSYTFTLNSV